MLFKKAVKNLLFMGGESTERVDKESTVSQKKTWAFGGPTVVFEDPATLATFSIGCARDAKYMAPDDFDYVINCAPAEVTVHHARLRSLDLEDTNTVTLHDYSQELSTILGEVRDVLKHEKSKIMCNCWMGASRSVAVTIFLLAMIYGPSKSDAEKDFNHFYQEIKQRRPAVNISVKLKKEVCAILDKKRGRALAPRYREQETMQETARENVQIQAQDNVNELEQEQEQVAPVDDDAE